jgi:hypothetical protein
MRERLRQHRGSLEITSSDRGTIVIGFVPARPQRNENMVDQAQMPPTALYATIRPMARRRRKGVTPAPSLFPDPYREMWASLTPAERLRRSWKLRLRLRNLKLSHDAKTFQLL